MLQGKLNADESNENNLLKANGVHDCSVTTGFYSRNGQIVQEFTLEGGSDESRANARRLLRHIKFKN